METIYINKQTINAKKETIFKRKLIIHDSRAFLAYNSRSDVRVISTQGNEDLIGLANELTNFGIKEEDIKPLIRIVSSYIKYEAINNKLIPTIREKVIDYYTYYHELDNETMSKIKNPNHEWYTNAVRLSQYKVAFEKTRQFKKLRIPIRKLMQKER